MRFANKRRPAAQAVSLGRARLENASVRWKLRQMRSDAVQRHERATQVVQAALTKLEAETQDIAGRIPLEGGVDTENSIHTADGSEVG